MAGKIIADTLETGAGADIATSYVVNGSAKAWIFTTDKTAYVPTASMNVSSMTDNGVARPETNFTNNFNDTNIVGSFDGGSNRVVGNYTTDGGIATSSFAHILWATNATNLDPASAADAFSASYLGDLA